jgi:hypothetical protein
MQTNFSPEQLPAWMRQPHRSFDWGVLLAAALGLIAAWAFFMRSGVLTYSDLLYSGFMATDLADGLREGQLFARWSPHVLGGYGAPIPTFLPQGAPFIVALIDQLFTGDIASAIRSVLIASSVGAATAQYLLCRRWVNPTAALMSAALYVFSPVLGLTAAHVAGDLAGTVAMALLPFLLWSASRAIWNASAWDVPLTALFLTALLYIHPMVAASGVAIATILTVQSGRAPLMRLVGAVAAAIGLYAPFWLPAMAYSGGVEWQADNPVGRGLITLRNLIEPVNAIDPVTLNPHPQYTVGMVLPVFAVCGLLWTVMTRRYRQFMLTMSVTALAAGAGAVISGANWPTYMLTMSVAALGGVALDWRSYLPFWLRRLAFPVALVLLLILSQPVWLSPFGPSTHEFTPQAQVEFEQKGFGVAVLPTGAPVPVTIRPGLAVERSLIESYESPPLTRIQLGTPVRVTPIYTGTHSSSWQVSTTVPTPLTISLAYFPGWKATLDGQALDIERTPSGLVRVSLPQITNGTLRITFDVTPEEGIGWIAVIAALIGMLMWVRIGKTGEPQSTPILNVQEVRLTSFTLAAIGLALISAAVPNGSVRLRPESYSSLRDSLPLTATSEPLRLLAYKFETTRLKPGDILPITFYWTLLKDTVTNYQVRLILIDIDRQIRYPLTSPTPPGNLPTGRWLAGYMVQDSYRLDLPTNLTPGTYQLSAEAYPCDTECDLRRPQRFFDSQGIERPSITLPTVLTIGG